ncbi:MAG: tetratricopeptide repeat protein [Planctomycetota bacterium]|jgi:tetratricopeptide (TPR) repeat protein|nr:tetratricopeptide repeat protein [Planctomycetota bacterium]
MDATENRRFEEALALLEERRYGEAVESFSAVIALSPDMAGAYGNRGLCYLNLGLDDQARNDFETVVQLDPDDAMGYSMLADLARFQGGPEDVLRQINLALARNPDEPQAHFLRGWLFARAGQYDLAAEDLGRFLELAGENDDVKDFYDACTVLASDNPPIAELAASGKADDYLGLRGWSFDHSENRDYEEQGLPCPYAHCIRNCRPLSPETPEGCPIFGNACPGRHKQVDWCREHPQMFD